MFAVRDATVRANLADLQMRPILFAGVMRDYFGSLPMDPSPILQVQSDLELMNGVEQLADGTVPLEIWLRNAVRNASQAEPRAVLERALDRVASKAAGKPNRRSAE